MPTLQSKFYSESSRIMHIRGPRGPWEGLMHRKGVRWTVLRGLLCSKPWGLMNRSTLRPMRVHVGARQLSPTISF